MSIKIQTALNFYNELSLLLTYSHRIYNEYIKSDKQFLYAKILYEVNRKIYDLLVQNGSRFNQSIDKDVIELLIHIDVWSAIWAHEFEIQSPSLKDKFNFDNDITFPKESIKRLLSNLMSGV